MNMQSTPVERAQLGGDGSRTSDEGPSAGPRSLQAQINRRINFLVFAVALMIALAVALTLWSAIKQDDITRTDSISVAQSAINTEVSGLERIVSDYANWDEAYENLSVLPDEAWWEENVQDDLFNNFGIVITAVYDAADRVLMSQQFSEEYLITPAFAESAELREFLNSVRASYGSETPSKTTYLELDGKIYIAAGYVVQPIEAEDKPAPEEILYEGSILVFFRPIDQSLIDHISENFLFPGLHLHKPGHGVKSYSLMLPLTSPSGRDLVHFSWYPEWPSRSILVFIVPPLVLLVIVILALVRYATSALRRSTDEIIRARDEAVAAERSKTTLLANMSHEFRTPLNGIIGFSELMTAGDLPPGEIGQYAEMINESGNQLLIVIEDVLSMAQLDMGVLSLQEAEFDLTGCARGALHSKATRARRQNIDLDLVCESDGITVRGDEAKLGQVIANLVANGIKFSPAGSRVTVEITESGGRAEIRVKDQGIGIAAQDIEKALRPFGQVEKTLDRQYAGTGLGLPIAKALVDLHGGTLMIDSEPDVGTTVTVTLPAERIVRAAAEERGVPADPARDVTSAA